MAEPFWPRKSPHFLACRRAVRLCWQTSHGGDTGGPVVIGLSGGPDSLALVAAALAEGVPVLAVVVNHNLQEGSAQVAGEAAVQARALGASTRIVHVDVDVERGGSVEAAARRARYAALFEVAAEVAGDRAEVWVAHTADDQAETLLLGALRGNPSGMLQRSGNLVRPFLYLRRADTVGACTELHLHPWHDPMNADPAFRRVAMRTEIIPALSELLGGDAVPALARTADRIAQSNEVIRELASASTEMDCEELAALPAVVRRFRIHAWLVEKHVHPNGAQLDAIERLVTHWRGQVGVELAGSQAVKREAGRLVVVPCGREVAR
ncbi:tRNA(Ile)-lysidine synthetase [Corynebacterium sp. HMSC30G07]|uniref:tRNA lysidine(34) synthetase TilS n=1 Tax=Corynebacterium sp. HMSC30G07 TaxID=1581072 RepID=UPI0008D70594|nr:tRNA lysidine(34) synthetase TilS [Corynebacterium sp. HMSC30G07]OFT76829.1 tRNA(Ile)-lysidine synthetase [Corynebacterium sp. HMSC30G07]